MSTFVLPVDADSNSTPGAAARIAAAALGAAADLPADGARKPCTEPPHSAHAQTAALARLYGEPLFELPADLYIPPDALEIFLEAFEGPLDLLLYLIRRQNFNILDIPMVPLTQQYMGYVEQVREHNLELAAEYLLMAAMLIEIKSRMLLPRPPAVGQEEAADPRAQLVQRLIEYEKTRLAARQLAALPQEGCDFWQTCAHHERETPAALAQVRPADLARAWQDILRRSALLSHHTITRERLSVRAYMSQVLRELKGKPYLAFEDLFAPGLDTPVLVVTFIALLELARESLIEITQAEAYAPIYLAVRQTAHRSGQETA